MHFGERIKEKRIAEGYTQEELGKLVGLTKSAIAKMETGNVGNLNTATAEKLAAVLNCSPSYLVGWNNNSQTVVANKEENKTFQFRLKTAMEKKNLKAVDLVRLSQPYCIEKGTSIDESLVSRYLKGERTPMIEKVSILARVLEVPLLWLLGYDNTDGETEEYALLKDYHGDAKPKSHIILVSGEHILSDFTIKQIDNNFGGCGYVWLHDIRDNKQYLLTVQSILYIKEVAE